jgi:hypothetical protein
MTVGLIERTVEEPGLPLFGSVDLVEGTLARRLEGSVADIVRQVSRQLDDIADTIISLPSAQIFTEHIEELFKVYVGFAQALGKIVSVKVGAVNLQHLLEDMLTYIQGGFMEADKCLGEGTYREIAFSIETLKNTYRLIAQIVLTDSSPECQLTEDQQTEDRRLGHLCYSHLMISHFHLHALGRAIHKSHRLPSDLLEVLLEGARESVMAYSYVRMAVDLRGSLDSKYVKPPEGTWDEEDQAFVETE